MKKYFLFIILWFSILLVSCWNNEVIENKGIQNNESSQTNTEEKKFTKDECMSSCKGSWNINANNKWKSTEEMNKSCNNICEYQQWYQNNDPTSCDKADDILKDACYSEIAKNLKDEIHCEKISSRIFKNACYINVAEAKKDSSICNKISDETFKDTCLTNSKK